MALRFAIITTHERERMSKGSPLIFKGWLKKRTNLANRFWVGGTGTWDSSTTTHWSASTGGSGGASVPGSADSATFDASSGGGIVTPNYDMTILRLVMGDFTGTLDFSANNNNPSLVGAGIPFNGGGTGVRTLNMGSGIWTIASSAILQAWFVNNATNFTLNANLSTIKIVPLSGQTGLGGFLGSGLVYNNVWFAADSSTTANNNTQGIIDSNTFNDFKYTSPIAINAFFQPGTITTVKTFTVSGVAGNLITLLPGIGSTGTYSLIKTGGGTVSSDYLNIQHSIATPMGTWFAGPNSVNNQAVSTAGSGWHFSAISPTHSPLPSHFVVE